MNHFVEQAAVAKTIRVLKWIWLSMLITLAVYLYVGRIVAVNPETVSMTDLPMTILRLVLYGFSVVVLFGTKRLRIMMTARAVARAEDDRESNPQSNPILGGYSTAVIVSLALAESIGIYGLILGILGRSLTDLHLLLLLSAVAMFYYRPNEEELSDLLQKRTS